MIIETHNENTNQRRFFDHLGADLIKKYKDKEILSLNFEKMQDQLKIMEEIFV